MRWLMGWFMRWLMGWFMRCLIDEVVITMIITISEPPH